VSGKPYRLSLGSTANKMGRVAGMNVSGGSAVFPGVLGTSILKAFDRTAARTGLTGEDARDAGFNPETVTVTTPTRAGYYPGGGTVTLTAVADRATRKFLGAEAVGTDSVDKIIDTAAGALTGALTVDDLLAVDISYSPPYSTATGTLIVAAQVLDDRLG
jgi:NADPH-dependent 2,4-dienoyl-CoA reductase/sulfur reductase-like enzyme